MLFTVIVHEDESGGYWAECLELPGCVSQGETLDEVDRNIREAIELVLEVKSEDGEDLSRLRTSRSTKSIDAHVRKWLMTIPLPEPSTVP
jgi:predicted RNase H-like HicB family nuclease